MRIKGRGKEHMYSSVNFRAASGSCGVRSKRGTGIPSCLSTKHLSAQPVCTSPWEA